jgi:phosphate acetyltransferase
MNFFENIKRQAREHPGIIVFPELGIDKDGVIQEAMEQVRKDGAAIPIGLTTEFIEKSEKVDEFAEAYPSEKKLSAEVRRKIIKKPVAFAAMMIRQGYAHGMIAGRYETSATVMMYARAIIGVAAGKIGSAIFFREPPGKYPVFDLIACADMVVNPDPDEEELCRIIVTSAETFAALTGENPTIALLSYISGSPQLAQEKDQNIQKIMRALELYHRGKHPWPIFQAQADAALFPAVAKNKGIPFEKPANLLIGSNLLVSNIVYKLLDGLIIGGDSMIFTQGFNYPAMDLSRSDSAANIANVAAACSVQIQKLETQGRYGKIDEYFLNVP